MCSGPVLPFQTCVTMGTICSFLNPFVYLLNGNKNLSYIPLRAVYGLNDIMHMHVLCKLFKALYNYKIYIIIKFLSFKYFKKAFQGWWLSSWVFFLLFSSAVPGDDHQAENHWPSGAVPMFPRWRRNHLSFGLLPLQPSAGAKGGF